MLFRISGGRSKSESGDRVFLRTSVVLEVGTSIVEGVNSDEGLDPSGAMLEEGWLIVGELCV